MQSESLEHVSMALTDVKPPEEDPEPPVADDPPEVDVEPPADWTEPSMVVSTLPLQLVTRPIPTKSWAIETSSKTARLRIACTESMFSALNVARGLNTTMVVASTPLVDQCG